MIFFINSSSFVNFFFFFDYYFSFLSFFDLIFSTEIEVMSSLLL